jgi:hypothetical protein
MRIVHGKVYVSLRDIKLLSTGAEKVRDRIEEMRKPKAGSEPS